MKAIFSISIILSFIAFIGSISIILYILFMLIQRITDKWHIKFRITGMRDHVKDTRIMIIRPLNIMIMRFKTGERMKFSFDNLKKFWVLRAGRILITSHPEQVVKAWAQVLRNQKKEPKF